MSDRPPVVAENDAVTKKSPNNFALLLRRTRKALAPFQHRLDQWQVKTATLRALLQRDPSHHDARAQAAALAQTVASSRSDLVKVVEQADAEVASHSLVRDVSRALERLEDELQQLGIAKGEQSSRP